jgi:hypothetical protein
MKKYKENEESRELFQRERRVGARPKTAITSIESGDAPADESSYAGMFGAEGHADLAMARKMGSAQKDVSGQEQV